MSKPAMPKPRHRPPRPPADISSRHPLIRTVAAGAALHRIHTAALPPTYFDVSTTSRFNAPASLKSNHYGVLYVAEDANGAFAETFLRQPGLTLLDPAKVAAKAYVRYVTTRAITLILLHGAGSPHSRRYRRGLRPRPVLRSPAIMVQGPA